MKLKEIYEKDITRYINPAVVVSEMDDHRIQQEINEYVFSKDIVENLYTFLKVITQKKEGKIGVWISGYYGSGKSHFIKYLFYCLHPTYRTQAFDRFINAVKDLYEERKLDTLSEVTLSNIQHILTILDRTKIEEIIFNIDTVSGSTKKEGTLTRILLNQFNKKRGYNSNNIAVALLIEKHLDQRGQFDEFKSLFQETLKEEWRDEIIRQAISNKLSTLIDIAHQLDPTLDKEALRTEIKKDAETDYTIEHLVQELNAYIQTKEESYRLIFLIDEVSQYIGSNTDLLLNLQTVVEDISTRIGPKVWIVCTAQEKLEKIDEKSGNFGKILGRFETRISLDSQDAAYITQKRVLEKNEKGFKVLEDFYQEHKASIENQFVFNHDLYPNYQNAYDFYRAYPFIPYQFRLISDVFQSFNTVGYLQEGVRNTERSILGITHFTAKKQKEEKVGYFISFDDFFNEQLNKNLTHPANNLLNRALQLQFSDEDKEFANRVIKVLFMISNLSEDKNINFPATVENISLLLINDVFTVKQKLQDQVQRILDQLVSKNVVQTTEGKYKFLDDDGIIVANAISAMSINTSTRLEYFYEGIIKPILQPNPRVNIGNKDIRPEIKLDDKIVVPGSDFTIKFVLYDDGDSQIQALNTPEKQLNINIHEWFTRNSTFQNQFMNYCKTARYNEIHRVSATGRRIRTLEDFARNNSILLQDLQNEFEQKFKETSFTSRQTVFEADTLSNGNPVTRYQAMIQKHTKELYNKHHLSDGLAQTNSELNQKINLELNQKNIDTQLLPAEIEIQNHITLMGNEVLLADVVKKFEMIPYGWKDITTLHIVFRLMVKNKRRLTFQNENLEPEDFYNTTINSKNREAIQIKSIKGYDPQTINTLKTNIKEIFIGYAIHSSEIKGIVEELKENILKPILKQANTLKNDYANYPFSSHFNTYHRQLADIYQTRSNDDIIQMINENVKQLKKIRDHFVAMESFVKTQFDGYEEIHAFVHNQSQNLENIHDHDLKEQIDDLVQYIKFDQHPDQAYPRIRKSFRKIQSSIREKTDQLKEELNHIYHNLFDELETKWKELKIDDPSILPDRTYHLEQIKKSNSLSALQLKKFQAKPLRQDTLIALADHTAEKEAAESGQKYQREIVNLSSLFTGQTLSNSDDIENFIDQLKNQLLENLKQTGKIILK